MGVLDIVILIVLAVGIARGWSTGFTRQAISLAGLILSFVLAVTFMDSLGVIIEAELGVSRELGPLVAFAAIFIVVKIISTFIARSADSAVKVMHLGGLNRIAGGAAGAIKAGFVMSLIFVAISYAHLPGDQARNDSMFYAPVVRIVPEAWRILNENAPRLDDIRRKFEARVKPRAAG